MNKISLTIIKILLILILLQPILITTCHAAGGFWSNVIETGDNFIEEADAQESPIDEDSLKEEVEKLYSMLFMIGVALTVIIGAVLGIKFILGSIEEQAKIKEMLIPYVVGCIVIFGAFGIWKLVITLLSKV